MSQPPPLPSPKVTVGHHFGSLLSCPQRAWYDFHGDPHAKAAPPSYLIALQREGIEHEQTMSRLLYPDAVSIPERGEPAERLQRTVGAMVLGTPAILQGYFAEEGGCGVTDVLELVRVDSASRTGHVYRVGEFKRAEIGWAGHV